MREVVNRWGLHAVCLLCGWKGRHRPEKMGRLHLRRCDTCGERSLASEAWVKRYPERAAERTAGLIEASRQGTLALEVEEILPDLRSPSAEVFD